MEVKQDVAKITQDYYNSVDADEFYFNIWGGEHIHVGTYNSKEEPIADASLRSVRNMASMLELDPSMRILEIGSGYGGTARYLAKNYNCHVTCLNISEKQNERNREMTVEQGLEKNIKVVDGSFEEIPFPENYFDAVWAMDTVVHSGNKEKVLEEVSRVLEKDGEFIFTDLMQKDDCPENVLEPVLDRIHLDSMGSFEFYEEVAGDVGLEKLVFHDRSEHLTMHYDRVKQETLKSYDEIVSACGKEYIDRMVKGLEHWVDAGNNGYLAWGVMHFRKA